MNHIHMCIKTPFFKIKFTCSKWKKFALFFIGFPISHSNEVIENYKWKKLHCNKILVTA